MNTLLVKEKVSMKNAFDNVVSGNDLADQLDAVFKNLDEILVNHCGPFASNAVIGSKWRQVNDIDEFTKDGIKIFRHLIVSEEVAARFAARMARFIGITVDSRCHDGTTTSMLLFCRLALSVINSIRSNLASRDRYLGIKNLQVAMDVCLDILNNIKVTEDDILEKALEGGLDVNIEDVRESIAYHMAMISSKGDHDLSSKIATIIRYCPKKIFGMFRNLPMAMETKERYILEKQDYDISVNANIGNSDDYNHRNDTEYRSENAVVFASASQVVNGSWESMFLRAFISTDPREFANLSQFGVGERWADLHENKRHLIILTPMLNDPDLMSDIFEFNRKNPENKITWFNIQIKDLLKTSFNKTLHYMAGVPIFSHIGEGNALDSFIGLRGKPVKVHAIGHVVTLTDLYKKDGEVYHPLYRDPEAFEPYTRFANETEEIINECMTNVTNPALDGDQLTSLTSMYRALTCQDIYDIRIGGSVHDQRANSTVYEDAMGAALSAVSEGVVLGGYGHLAKGLLELSNSKIYLGHSEISKKFLGTIGDVMVSIVRDSLRASDRDDVEALIISSLTTKWRFIAAAMSKVDTYSRPADYMEVGELDNMGIEEFLKRTPDKTFLLQAYSGYEEQILRCRDLLTKLTNTTHLVDMRISDGANVS
jgi:hypothetical protein